MRCPHCATIHPTRPVCRRCGRSVDEASQNETLVGLDPTLYEHVDVKVDRIDGVETTQDVLGDISIPGGTADEARPDDVHCRRCGQMAGDARFCERCGFTVRPGRPRTKTRESEPPLRCLDCGVKNPRGRSRCLACGIRL